MPIINGIGQGDCTIEKENIFRALLGQHIAIVREVLGNEKNYWASREYVYIDLYAGSGRNEEVECDGSPVIFLKTIKDKLRYKAHFVEKRADNCKALREVTLLYNSCTIYEGDNKDVLPGILKSVPPKSYGLVYVDPNGIADWDLIYQVTENPKYKFMDILLYLSATSYKRARTPVDNFLNKVSKSNWIIREPVWHDQWTFLFGTNYLNYNPWKSLKMHKLKSIKGQVFYNTICHTTNELKAVNQLSYLLKTPNQVVRERSQGICERCNWNDVTEVHHKSYPPVDTPDNLIAVCHQCHCKIHGKEN
jgi:hypothetical protein